MNTQNIAAQAVVLPDGAGGLEVVPATITVERGAITTVTRGLASGAEALGGLVAPAFVNAHTHLSMSAFRGIGGVAAMRGNVVEDLYFRLESQLQPGDVYAFARLAAAESLLAGVGTVWDHYYAGGEVASACADAGLAAVIAPTLQDLEGPGVPSLEAQLDATLAIAADARLRSAGVVAALGPHATDTVSAALWARVADLAARYHLPIHCHAAQSHEEFVRAQERHGLSPIGWLRREGWLDAAPSALLVHALYADRSDLEGLDPSRVALGFCPASQIQYCFPAHTTGWRELGQRVVIGTDCGACNDGMNVQQELRLAASGPLFAVSEGDAFRAFWDGDAAAAAGVAADRVRVQRANEARPEQLLQMVLGNPGDLHPSLRVGAIAAGHRADLVWYDTDHPCFWPATDPLRSLALQDVAPSIRRMMLGGRWLSAPNAHQRAVLDAPWRRDALDQARHRLGRMRW